MKKLFFLLVFFVSHIVIYAQDEKSTKEPQKFASWTISECFQAEAGFVGSYWKPTFNIQKTRKDIIA